MSDFYDILMAQPEEEAKEIALSLELFVNGSLNIFNHQTNVDVDNRFVVYGIRDLGTELSPSPMLVMMESIQQRYLKEYIGEYFEISETSEKIYIGSDFPDEFSHSNDTKGLKGANMKAKANITPAIGELIQIASEKAQYPDYNNKHGAKAQFGWYRYNTRFGIPVYDEDGNLDRYNIFSTRMLVRCDADGKLYLYDLVRTKKETSKPHEQ